MELNGEYELRIPVVPLLDELRIRARTPSSGVQCDQRGNQPSLHHFECRPHFLLATSGNRHKQRGKHLRSLRYNVAGSLAFRRDRHGGRSRCWPRRDRVAP